MIFRSRIFSRVFAQEQSPVSFTSRRDLFFEPVFVPIMYIMKKYLFFFILLALSSPTLAGEVLNCEQRVNLAYSEGFGGCAHSPGAKNIRTLFQFSTYREVLKCQEEYAKYHCDKLKDSMDYMDQWMIRSCQGPDICQSASEKTTDIAKGCGVGVAYLLARNLTAAYKLGKAFLEGLESSKVCSTGPHSLENKKLFYAVYNSQVPSGMRINQPPDSTLNQEFCGEIYERLNTTFSERIRQLTEESELKERLKLPLSPELQEFVDWKKNRSTHTTAPSDSELMKKAMDYIHTQIANFECYNTMAKSTMVCEAIAQVVWTTTTKIAPAVLTERTLLHAAEEASAKAAAKEVGP